MLRKLHKTSCLIFPWLFFKAWVTPAVSFSHHILHASVIVVFASCCPPVPVQLTFLPEEVLGQGVHLGHWLRGGCAGFTQQCRLRCRPQVCQRGGAQEVRHSRQRLRQRSGEQGMCCNSGLMGTLQDSLTRFRYKV